MNNEKVVLATDHILMGGWDCAYRDEMTITSSLISYKRWDIDKKLICEWKYNIKSEDFNQKFRKLVQLIYKESNREYQKYLNNEYPSICTDIGDYELTYENDNGEFKELNRYEYYLEKEEIGISETILDMIPKGKLYSGFLEEKYDDEFDEDNINQENNNITNIKQDLGVYDEDAKFELNDLIEKNLTYRIIEFEFEKHPNLNYNYYKNGKYYGSENNPYFILVQVVGDENGYFEPHKDTKLIALKAFKLYSLSNKNYKTLNKLVINETIQSSLGALMFLSVKEIYLNGDNDLYYCKDLDYLKNVKFIYAPDVTLSKINYKNVRNLMVAAYLNKKELYTNDDICEEYEIYLKKKYKDMYLNLDNDVLLNYLLKNKLINEIDLYDLIKNEKNQYVLDTLKEYAKDFDLSINKEKEIAIELYNDQMKNLNAIQVINNTPTKDMNTNLLEKIKVNLPYKRKVQTYWRGFVKVGDVFYCEFDDSCAFFQIVKESKALRFKYKCKMLTASEIEKLFKDSLCDSLICVTSNNKSLIVNKSNNAVLNIKNNLTITKDIYYTKGVEFEMSMDLGVFKHIIYDDKLIELPDIQNKKTIHLHEQLLKLFEAYFEIPINDTKLIFRKVNFKHIVEQLFIIPNKLMTSAMDLRTSIIKPYQYIKDVTEYYTNSSGKRYKIIDIFNFINKLLTIGNNDVNFRIVQSSFSKFYQNMGHTNFEGFNKEDIMYFLNNYFVFDYALGFYYGWDTIEEINNDILCYDKRWFRVFYDTVRKNKTKDLKSCDEIDKLINVNKTLEFNKYVINDNDVSFFIELAKQVNSFERYIDVIKPYFIKILNNF